MAAGWGERILMTCFWKTACALAAAMTTSLLGGAVRAQSPAEPMVHAYWVCAMDVTISQGVGGRLNLLGPTRREYVLNMYIANFETTETAQALALNRDRYNREFTKAVQAAGYQTVSIDGDAGIAFCGYVDNPAAARAKKASYLAEMFGAGGTIHATYNGIDIPWSPKESASAPPLAATSGSTPAAAPASGSLGGAFEDVTAQTARFAGLDPARGAVVVTVDKGSPAEKAGLKPTDIVTEINGQAVGGAADVAAITSRLRAGYKAPLQVWRNKAVVSLTVEMPPAPAVSAAAATAALPAAAPAPPGIQLGVRLVGLTPRLAVDLSRTPATGAVIAIVTPGGNASASGIRPLDVVTALNGEAINTNDDLVAALARVRTLPAKVTLWRDGGVVELALVKADASQPTPPQTGVCAAALYRLDGQPTDLPLVSAPWATKTPADEASARTALESFVSVVAKSDSKVRLEADQVQSCTLDPQLSCVRYNMKYRNGGGDRQIWMAAIKCGKSLPDVYTGIGQHIDWRSPAF
jgi:membrane-associated protease RseP (regulator of RpoE activity)